MTAYEKSQPYSHEVNHISSSYIKSDDYESVIVNLNTADIYSLQEVPGIGDALSKKIVSYRESKGGFESVDELLNIEEISAATFEKIKPYVTV